MLDHVSFPVKNLEQASQFYDDVLATLDCKRQVERPGVVGYGRLDRSAPCFWILASKGQTASPGRGLHVSFAAESREAVRAFHEAALRAGGSDAGEPGERPHYVGNFYGCFVVDLDGFKVEATSRTG